MTQTRVIAGFFFYALALLFLLVTLGAAISTWRTGRFRSGLPVAPTIFAIVGGLFTGSWKASLVIVLLDLGSLFLPKESARPKPAPGTGRRTV